MIGLITRMVAYFTFAGVTWLGLDFIVVGPDTGTVTILIPEAIKWAVGWTTSLIAGNAAAAAVVGPIGFLATFAISRFARHR